MASTLISGEARHSRLSELLDSLASPDREKPHHGLTLWQTVRMYGLQSRWFDVSTSYKAFFDVAGDTTPCLSIDEDGDLADVWVNLLDAESAVFYLAGVRFGEQIAEVGPVTRRAIASAILATARDHWYAIVGEAADEDPWEAAAEWAAELEYEAQGKSPSKDARAQWVALLDILEGLHPEQKEFLGKLDNLLREAIPDLRRYMFKEGRLDGEAVSGGITQ